MTHPFIRLSLLGESIACDNAQAIGILDPLKPITQCGPAGPIQLLSGLSVQPDGKINLNGWADGRAASIWVPDYNGVLTEIPGGTPLVVDSGTGRTPRFDGTDYWATDPGGTPLPLTGEWVFEHWSGSTNYFLNSFAPATQTITLSATGDYTLSVHGTDSVSIAAGTAVGTGWGTATDGSPVTVNITTAGSVTCTVTGSPTAVQLEDKQFATPVIQTTGAALTRDLSDPRIERIGHINDAEGYAIVIIEYPIQPDQNIAMGWHLSNICYGINDQTTLWFYDGAGIAEANIIGIPPVGSRLICAMRWSTVENQHQIAVRKSGESTWNTQGSSSYSGSLSSAGTYLQLNKYGEMPKITVSVELFDKDIGLAAIEDKYSLANLGY